ncbi:Putative AC9 transposase [Frankliniella fusca]|uniref:AC9 transposase n=1 Tax=Frankliniella fusca TaxID=407009 RepID=A0AAE1GZF8_9NEOP|nr:Putative AC9 transposase [Frankliniella fusca]
MVEAMVHSNSQRALAAARLGWQHSARSEHRREELPTATETATEDEGFWSDLDRAVQLANVNTEELVSGGMPVELRQYLNRPPVDRKTYTDPLIAWEGMREIYPHVYAVALKFLPLLATSVPSERLFSHAGLIATQLRNRLSPQNLNMLLLLCIDAKPH